MEGEEEDEEEEEEEEEEEASVSLPEICRSVYCYRSFYL